MAYCTHSDLESRLSARKLIQCLDDERLAQAATTLAEAVTLNPRIETRLDAILEDASADCDMYLRQRYHVPIEDVPVSVRKICIDLSLYYVHAYRGSEFEPPEQIQARRALALERLESISQAGLDVGSNVQPPGGTRPAAKLSQATAQLTPTTLEDM